MATAPKTRLSDLTRRFEVGAGDSRGSIPRIQTPTTPSSTPSISQAPQSTLHNNGRSTGERSTTSDLCIVADIVTSLKVSI